METIRPGDPVYAFRHGCGLGLAFRGIVLDIQPIADGKGTFNARALVLDTSVAGKPRLAESTRLHPDNGVTREEAAEILLRHGYKSLKAPECA